jgi:hypothetical protein
MTSRPKPAEGCEHIDLGDDSEWYLEVPLEEDDDGRQQGFIFRPDGRESASVNAAEGLGHLTGEFETPIPDDVLADLSNYSEQYA